MDICQDPDLCTGCMACADKCKRGAISFYRDYEGFLYPKIDPDKCNNCGLCQKQCHVNVALAQELKPKATSSNESEVEPEVYLVQASEEERMKSSSGGFCAALAQRFVANHSYVVGCVSSGTSAEHIVTAEQAELARMRGSKYIQSSLEGVYLKVQNLLKQGNKVLFTGLPCQVAALKAFLVKNYDNLTTVDLICHGVCSDELLRKVVVRELKQCAQVDVDNIDIADVIFRDKNIDDLTITISYSSKGDGQEHVMHIPFSDSLFYRLFLSNFVLRRSCGDCQYAGMWPRQGDFTAGDFRGIPEFEPYLDQKGTSIVFANTPKAVNLMSELKEEGVFARCLPVPFASAQRSQINLVQSTSHHPSRESFFKHCYGQLEQAEVPLDLSDPELIRNNVAILNFSFEESNYGAILTCAGLYQAVKKLGYNVRIIDYIPYFVKDHLKNSLFMQFKANELEFTKTYYGCDSLTELNNDFSAFIVGSDQVLNHRFVSGDRVAYYLSFVEPNKKMICYAGSFGLAADDYLKLLSSQDKAFYGTSLNIFDAVSLREPESGRKICEALGCNNAVGVLDPVFICGADYWRTLAAKAPKLLSADNEIVEYIVPVESPIYDITLPNGFNAITRVVGNVDGCGACSPYEWLNLIENCSLFITDSFHGVCFALIFNRPFVVNSYSAKILVRINELLDLIDPRLKERVFLGKINDIDKTLSALHEPDWAFVNARIEELKSRALKFLQDNLEHQLLPQEIERKVELKRALVQTELRRIKQELTFCRIKRSLYQGLKLINQRKFQPKVDKYQFLIRKLKGARSCLKI
ncbi:MAG TPA: polysaccharide pyruvyl transferase family protein [Candidatus Anaerobiospirillum stercoravium]|nr:polysaccharide pyruvyl transferase family protein [Candidatus Anaerobiospirillum stercoravium]